MSREWKPGDVAERSYLGGVLLSMRVSRGLSCRDTHDAEDHWHHSDGGWDSDQGASTYRPLVVIDPEDREQVERLAKAMHESDHIAPWHDLHNETRAQIEDAMQAALREFANPTPPKPKEPTGLGAVVEDMSGLLWTRVESGSAETRNPWYPAGDPDVQPEEYRNIDAVRVLSEGVAA